MSISISELGEVMNRKGGDVIPKVGMAATLFVGSDCYPMVITKVYTPKKVEVVHLDHDFEKYIIKTDEGEYIRPELAYAYTHISGEIFTMRKNKRWVQKGVGLHGCGSIGIGHAEYYLDPSF